jgi:hypothetical protein
MADGIQIITKLYATKGGAYLGSEQTSISHTMTGTHMASGTQNIATGAGNAELLDVPGDVTGDRYILIKNLEAEGGNYIEIGSASAGSFPASVSQKVKGGATVLLCRKYRVESLSGLISDNVHASANRNKWRCRHVNGDGFAR